MKADRYKWHDTLDGDFPDSDRDVIIADGNSYDYAEHLPKLMIAWYDEQKQWWTLSDGGRVSKYEVPYWCEIPHMPKSVINECIEWVERRRNIEIR